MARQIESTAAAAPKAKSSHKKIPKPLQKVAKKTAKKIAAGSADGDDDEEGEGNDEENAKLGAKGVSSHLKTRAKRTSALYFKLATQPHIRLKKGLHAAQAVEAQHERGYGLLALYELRRWMEWSREHVPLWRERYWVMPLNEWIGTSEDKRWCVGSREERLVWEGLIDRCYRQKKNLFSSCYHLVHPTLSTRGLVSSKHIVTIPISSRDTLKLAVGLYAIPATPHAQSGCPSLHTYARPLYFTNPTKPHTHPMPPLTKMSVDLKHTYTGCIEDAGTLGATVNKVDNARTTKLRLGKPPSLFSPAYGNRRHKKDIIFALKAKKYPAGFGVAGVFELYSADQKRPPEDRYIHCRTTPGGGIIIITGVPFLIKLLDDPGVTSFDDDTTFKRIAGEMNEWEISLFFKAVLRAATVIRAYVNRATTDYYEILFDELQRIKLQITKKVLRFKRFVPGGNLLAMNVDMEAAQVLGAARSILKTNQPEYRGIPRDTSPAEAATYFVKLCYRHSKEAIHDFKPLVTPAQYERLMTFMYIDSKERLDEFSQCEDYLTLGVISDWWAHKEMSDWIIPCLAKSRSRMHPEDWDSTPSTTNTGETQHHWTNSLTGTNLSLVEAIERRESFPTIKFQSHVDETVAQEIEASMRNGILANEQNEAYHRLSRNLQRQAKAAQKVRKTNEVTAASKNINADIADLQEARRQSSAKEKALREELRAMKGATTAPQATATRARGHRNDESAVFSASSTGPVKPTATTSAPSSTGTSQHTELDFLMQIFRPPGDVQVGSSAVGLESEETAQWTAFDLNLQEFLNTFDMNMPDGFVDVPSMSHIPTDGSPDVSGLDYGLSTWGPCILDELISSPSMFPGAYSPSTAEQYGVQDQLPILSAPSPLPTVPSSPAQTETAIPARGTRKRRREEVDTANIIGTARVRRKSAKVTETLEEVFPLLCRL
ncbi:hypothetical protein B0H14DRAFT_2575464 [Mycena olivaceomarginata]|nr:hypothetical protein B0H14DRAFT_2575464 [Mycena olivaceomarginata]